MEQSPDTTCLEVTLADNVEMKYITAFEELQAVPPGWWVKLEGKHYRVAFHRIVEIETEPYATYEHPVYGWLPIPWELRKDLREEAYFYYNTATNESVESGPRKILRPPSPPLGSIRVRPESMGTLVRQVVSGTPLIDQYPRILTLDPGCGKLGGMNGGVYVVKSTKTNQLYVEKVFRGCYTIHQALAKNEIIMMRRLIHNSIIQYVAGFMNEKPFVASVYMEFCDRGTLEDLIKTYKIQKKIHSPARIPESFIWHAFVGLADALGYLQTGQSYVSTPLENNDPKKWRPIMHCDIKPGNIFLRSRDTPGSKKPFYVLLSDFGLVQYQDAHENTIPYVYGTSEFQSPELCFDPYPRESQRNIMAGPHTCKSDVWALAASMFGMCERDELAHMDRRCWPLRSLRALGRIAKRPVLNITDVGLYSEYLARAIAWAGNQDPSKRPDGWELVVKVKAQYDLWLADADWKTQVEVKGALPPEATKDIKALVIRNEQAEDLGNGAYYIS